jgi:hypothetical protein
MPRGYKKYAVQLFNALKGKFKNRPLIELIEKTVPLVALASGGWL